MNVIDVVKYFFYVSMKPKMRILYYHTLLIAFRILAMNPNGCLPKIVCWFFASRMSEVACAYLSLKEHDEDITAFFRVYYWFFSDKKRGCIDTNYLQVLDSKKNVRFTLNNSADDKKMHYKLDLANCVYTIADDDTIQKIRPILFNRVPIACT